MKEIISIKKCYGISFSKGKKHCLDSCPQLQHDEHACVAFGVLLDFKEIDQYKYDGIFYKHLRCNGCLLATQKEIK